MGQDADRCQMEVFSLDWLEVMTLFPAENKSRVFPHCECREWPATGIATFQTPPERQYFQQVPHHHQPPPPNGPPTPS